MSEESGTRGAALQTRRVVYFALVGAALVAGVLGAVASGKSREAAPAWLDVLVVAFLVLTATGLLLIGARSTPYTLGLFAFGSTLLPYWLVSPKGEGWRQSLVEPLGPSGLLLPGSFMLFVVAWMLLARSVLGWVMTFAPYLGLGLLLMVLYTLVVEPIVWYSGVIFALLWPWVVLGLIGIFGYILPGG